MTAFIREPWILSSLYAQIYKNTEPVPSLQCQLIEVVRETETLEVVISDGLHYITAILSNKSISSFKTTYAQDWPEIKGCFVTLDDFFFDYLFEKNVFFVDVEEFSYFGSESETIGDPTSVNKAKDICEILSNEICMKMHSSMLDVSLKFLESEHGERRCHLERLFENGYYEGFSEKENVQDSKCLSAEPDTLVSCKECSGDIVGPEEESPRTIQDSGNVAELSEVETGDIEFTSETAHTEEESSGASFAEKAHTDNLSNVYTTSSTRPALKTRPAESICAAEGCVSKGKDVAPGKPALQFSTIEKAVIGHGTASQGFWHEYAGVEPKTGQEVFSSSYPGSIIQADAKYGCKSSTMYPEKSTQDNEQISTGSLEGPGFLNRSSESKCSDTAGHSKQTSRHQAPADAVNTPCAHKTGMQVQSNDGQTFHKERGVILLKDKKQAGGFDMSIFTKRKRRIP